MPDRNTLNAAMAVLTETERKIYSPYIKAYMRKFNKAKAAVNP
jgi:hypothetical protein